MNLSKLLIFFIFFESMGVQVRASEKPVVTNEVTVGVEESPEEAGSEYSRKKSKLSLLNNELQTYEDELKLLVQRKNDPLPTENTNDILDQMVTVNKKIEEKEGEIRSLEADLRFKYPEKNRVTHKRKYIPVRSQTEDMVEDVKEDIDVTLTQYKDFVEKKYSQFLSQEDKKEMAKNRYFRELSSVKKDPNNEPKKRLRLVK